MSELAIKTVCTIGTGESTRDVVVKELTPAILRSVLLSSALNKPPTTDEDAARSQIDAWLLEDCRLSDLVAFTDLSLEQVEALPPSQLKIIKQKVKDINPDFFGALERMAKARGMR